MEEKPLEKQPAASLLNASVFELEPLESVAAETDCKYDGACAGSDIVLTQPGLGVTTTTITTVTQTGGGWSTGLFHICGDRTTCVLGAVAPCLLDFMLAHQYGECLCLPLLPGSTFALRVGIRERYKIRGSVCEDWTTACCCYPLAVCQMIREMKQRMKTQTYHVSTALECS